MIKKFVKAWDKYNNLLLKFFQKENPTSYEDILEKLVEIVINPYLKELKEYPENRGLDIKNMTIINNGDYQGTLIFIIPYDTYQPDTSAYVFTSVNYGSCSCCDTFQSIEVLSDDKKSEAGKQFHTLALHLLQSFKYFESEDQCN